MSLTFNCRWSTAAVLVCYCYFISTKFMGVMMEYMSLLMDLLIKKKTLWPQLPQGYRATKRRQCSFYHLVPKNYWYSFNRPRIDERLNGPWSHPVVLYVGQLDYESSALTTRPCRFLKRTLIYICWRFNLSMYVSYFFVLDFVIIKLIVE